MANKLKFKGKKKQYYCVECERCTIEHKPSDLKDDVIRRCKICKKDCLFIPSESDW